MNYREQWNRLALKSNNVGIKEYEFRYRFSIQLNKVELVFINYQHTLFAGSVLPTEKRVVVAVVVSCLVALDRVVVSFLARSLNSCECLESEWS